MSRHAKVVVHWTKEAKAGIEPINFVPENSRYVGAVTTVKFSGDKKWYPGKIVMISEDTTALEAKADELSRKLHRLKEAESAEIRSRKRKTKSSSEKVSVASERDVALAIGEKPPILPELVPAKKAAIKVQRDASAFHKIGQNKVDDLVGRKVRKSLFTPEQSYAKANQVGEDLIDDDENDGSESNGGISPSDSSEGSDNSDEDVSTKDEVEQCLCAVCKIMRQHSNPSTIQMLKDLVDVLEDTRAVKATRYLPLLHLPSIPKPSELTLNSGVFILPSDKDRLKVDFKNKPGPLIRETLYTLYGKAAFANHIVTSRGTKPGSYGIEDRVLKALQSFVNRHVHEDKRITCSKLASIINKRAPEWHSKAGKGRSPSLLLSDKKVSRKRTSIETSEFKERAKVISVSSFKYTPVKSPRVSGSPMKTTPLRELTPKKVASPKKVVTAKKAISTIQNSVAIDCAQSQPDAMNSWYESHGWQTSYESHFQHEGYQGYSGYPHQEYSCTPHYTNLL